jgi:hypothetical protein
LAYDRKGQDSQGQGSSSQTDREEFLVGSGIGPSQKQGRNKKPEGKKASSSEDSGLTPLKKGSGSQGENGRHEKWGGRAALLQGKGGKKGKECGGQSQGKQETFPGKGLAQGAGRMKDQEKEEQHEKQEDW